MVQVVLQPYQSPRDNHLETMTLFSLVVISAIATDRTSDDFLVPALFCVPFFLSFSSSSCLRFTAVTPLLQLIATVVILCCMSVALITPVVQTVWRRVVRFFRARRGLHSGLGVRDLYEEQGGDWKSDYAGSSGQEMVAMRQQGRGAEELGKPLLQTREEAGGQ